jgi:hypothetical protein
MFTDFPNTALFPLCADAPKSKMETRLDSWPYKQIYTDQILSFQW